MHVPATLPTSVYGSVRMPPTSDHLLAQIVWLFVLAVPVACVAWTVTHEEVFREPREFCKRCSESCQNLAARKFRVLLERRHCLRESRRGMLTGE